MARTDPLTGAVTAEQLGNGLPISVDANSISSRYVPWVVGGWYTNPLQVATRTIVNTTNRLFVHPYFSGPDGLTIDKLDASVNTVGSAGTVLRMGAYRINNQSRPFAWVAAQPWASLLVDAGTVATDSGTGQKVITLGTALVIPPNTWFAVGGADQIATAATRQISGQSGGNWATPFGNSGGASYGGTPGISLYQDSVTGALPSSFVPLGTVNLDSGVGLHRSA
jgi:hypothetical protein